MWLTSIGSPIPTLATEFIAASGLLLALQLGFRSLLGVQPLSNHLFLFANARRNRLKVLYFGMEWGRRKVQEGNREQRTSHILR